MRGFLDPVLRSQRADPSLAREVRGLAEWLSAVAADLDAGAQSRLPLVSGVGPRGRAAVGMVRGPGARAISSDGPDATSRRTAEITIDWTTRLKITVQRAALKGRACALAKARLDAGEDVAGSDEADALLSAASELPRCNLWAFDRRRTMPTAEALELCAKAYANLSRAVEVVQSIDRWREGTDAPPEKLLFLAAEAQSALWAALGKARVESDPDQLDLFIWVREVGAAHRIFVARHMRMEDPADPTKADELNEKLQEFGDRIAGEEQQRKGHEKLIGKLDYEAGRLERAEDDSARTTAWDGVVRSLTEWVSSGRSPNNRAVCDPIRDFLDDMPDDVEVTDEAQLVFDAIDDEFDEASRDRLVGTLKIPLPWIINGE